MARPATLRHLILDVDGVLTTGQFLYTQEGKFAKVFGPHDADGLKLIKPHLEISAISADHRGFAITAKRIQADMGLKLTQVAESERLAYFKNMPHPGQVAYMGDGIYDAAVFKIVGYGLAPANAWPTTKKRTNFVTTLPAGQGAVAEACFHLLHKFFPHVTLP